MIIVLLQFLQKKDQPNEETHRAKSGRILDVDLSCPLPMESGCIMLLGHSGVFTNQEAIQDLASKVLLGFQYIGTTD